MSPPQTPKQPDSPAPAPAAPDAPPAPAAVEHVVPLEVWLTGDPSQRTLAAALLARKPELVDAELTEKAWQDALEAERTTPTEPAVPDPATTG